jgi:tripartite-type tricarboxylate transporter receptor subunit TctC
MKRKTFLGALAGAALSFGTQRSFAQGFPSRPLTLVSPFPAGSGSDLTARAVTKGLSEALGQPVVVENRPGAGGAIGAQYVAHARADGYTMLLASLSFSVLPSLQALSFDPVKDFQAITLMGEQPMAFVVPASLSVKSMRELVALAKSRPHKLNYASAGIGSIGHLAGELFKRERAVDIVHVPFKGTPEALSAIISGEVQIGLIAMPAAEPQIRAGKVRALAVTGTKRYQALPDVPTMVESGFPSLSDSVWYAVLVPAATPHDVVARLNAAFRTALAQPATIAQLEGPAKTTPTVSSPEEATAYLRAQVAKWGGVASAAGLKPVASR